MSPVLLSYLTKTVSTADNLRFFGIVVAGVGAVALIGLWQSRKRRVAMQTLATTKGLSFQPQGLPPDFPPVGDGVSNPWSTGFWLNALQTQHGFGKPYNVVFGAQAEDYLVALDIDYKSSRSSMSMTLVSVLAKEGTARPLVSQGLVYTEDGRWRFLQRRNQPYWWTRLSMTPQEIEGLWTLMLAGE